MNVFELVGKLVIDGVDNAQKQLSGLEGYVQKNEKAFKAMGAAMTGFGVAITGTLAMSLKAAAAEEAGIRQLSIAMTNVGLSYENSRESLESWINSMQQATSISDTDMREALSTLVVYTNDLSDAQDLLTLAMDMSAGTGKDLASVTSTLGYAIAGNWGMVNRMIPALASVQDEEEKWAKLREMFAGQAEEYGKTLEGQMNLLKNNVGDVMEALGSTLIPMLTDLFQNRIQPIIEKVKAWIEENPQLTQTIVIMAGAIGVLMTFLGPLLMILPGLTTAVGLFGAVMQVAMGPVGWITLAIAGLVAAGIALWRNWDKVVNFFEKAWQNIKIFFLTGVEKVLDTLENFTSWIPGVGDAVKRLHDKVSSMLETEQVKRDSKRIQEEMAELTATVEEEFATQSKAIQEAYDEERAAAQNAYDDAIKAINEDYGIIEEEAEESSKTRIELAEEACEAAKDSYEEEKDAAKDRYDAERDEIERTYDAKMAALDDEYDAQVSAIDKQIDAIKDAEKAQDLARERAEERAKLAGLQEVIDNAETEEEKAEAIAEYEEYAAEVAEKEADRARDAQIEALEDRKDAARDAYKEKKKQLQDEKDAELEALETTYNATVENYKKLAAAADEKLREDLANIEKGRQESIKAEKDKYDAEIQRINNAEQAEIEHFANQLAATYTQIEAINTAYDALQKQYTITITTVHQDIYPEPETPPDNGGGDTGGTSTGSVTGYASGGIIDEPTWLTRVGETTPYGIMAENGPERISKTGIGDVVITGNNFTVREEADINKIGAELIKQIRLQQGLRGA